jgi:hypothetical protein
MTHEYFDLNSAAAPTDEDIAAAAGFGDRCRIRCDIGDLMHDPVVRPLSRELRLARESRARSMPAAVATIRQAFSVKDVPSGAPAR